MVMVGVKTSSTCAAGNDDHYLIEFLKSRCDKVILIMSYSSI